MNLGDVVGQLMQHGMNPATQQRLQHAAGQNGLGGLGDILGSVLGGNASGGAPAASQGGLGGLLGTLGQAMGADSGIGGMSRGQVGGIGALAGAILGGGGSSVKGAVGGSAMALLGTLAISALQNWQAQQAGQGAQSGAAAGTPAAPALSEDEMQQMVSPDTAELCLRGMIEAVKSDGEVSPEEIDRIVGKLGEDGITADEKQFVAQHLRQPPDVQGLIAAIPNREVGAQVYAAALMAITVDTPEERAFLGALARGAGLDDGAVTRLHALVGAPAAA